MNKLELTMPNAQYGFGKSGGSVLLRHICGKQSLVLHLNICGENHHLRQVRKRWAQCLK